MSATDSKSVVERFVGALASGDEAVIRDCFAADATWWLAGDLPISGTHTGADNILADFFGVAQRRFAPGSVTLRPGAVVGGGDHFVADWTVTGTSRLGRAYRNDYLASIEVRDGKIASVREYTDIQHVADVLFEGETRRTIEPRVLQVAFNSVGTLCAGTLFLPADTSTPVPGVVLCHGFSAVRGMTLPKYARALAAAGIAVLTFDYRFIGDSGGEPRYQVYPENQREDIRNALTWLAERSEIDADRLGLWGSSLGGGHVIQVAVHDRRVRAILTQVPAVSPAKVIHNLPEEARARLFDALAADRIRRSKGGGRQLIPICAPEGEFSALGPNDLQWHIDMERDYPPFANLVTLDSMDVMAQNDPGAWVDWLRVPVLMIVCENDQTADPELALQTFKEMPEPKELITYRGDHYDVYDNDDMRAKVISAATQFFRANL